MNTQIKKAALIAAAAGIVAVPGLSFSATPASAPAVSLTQDPVVMRLSQDEFRIAFGLNAGACAASDHGCSGTIRYRVDWKTDDGTIRSENRRVAYTVLPRSNRALTVDRQYFDTAEGAHRTEILKVSVGAITCVDGTGTSSIRTASLASP